MLEAGRQLPRPLKVERGKSHFLLPVFCIFIITIRIHRNSLSLLNQLQQNHSLS